MKKCVVLYCVYVNVSLHSCVGVRRYAAQFLLDSLADGEGLDELLYGGVTDGTASAGEGLERLVGVGVSLTTEDGLNGFGTNCPTVVEVAVYRLTVEDKFVESLQRALYADEHVGKGHADVAQHGAVGEVALEAAYGQLAAEMSEYSVGNAEVAL